MLSSLGFVVVAVALTVLNWRCDFPAQVFALADAEEERSTSTRALRSARGALEEERSSVASLRRQLDEERSSSGAMIRKADAEAADVVDATERAAHAWPNGNAKKGDRLSGGDGDGSTAAVPQPIPATQRSSPRRRRSSH